jgi:hypothetical protein
MKVDQQIPAFAGMKKRHRNEKGMWEWQGGANEKRGMKPNETFGIVIP